MTDASSAAMGALLWAAMLCAAGVGARHHDDAAGAWYSSPPLLPVLVASSDVVPDPVCRNHFAAFVKALGNFTLWAVQMLDASAKLPVGVVDGDVNQLGSFDECLGVSAGDLRGQYCLLELAYRPLRYSPANATTTAPDPFAGSLSPYQHAWEKLKLSQDRSKVRRDVLNWAVCVPASCPPTSLQATLDHEARAFAERTGLRVNATVRPSRCSVARPGPPYSLGEIAYSAVVAVLFLAVVISTIYDVNYCCDTKESEAEGGKKGWPAKLLLCFSAKRNLRGLANVVQYHPALDAIDGIRLAAMVLVILGHRFSMFNSMPTLEANQFEQFFHRVAAGILLNGTLLVDFFFVVSAILLAYHLTLHLEKGRGVNLFMIFAVRFFRLTPSYMLVVFFHATVLHRLGSGPLWQEVVGLDRQRCSDNWWTNLLYVNNYVNVEAMCLYQSWYLSVDTQMFLVSILLMYCIFRWPLWGYSTATLLGVASVGVPFFTTWWKRADGFLVPFADVTNDVIGTRYFQEIYVRTENRAAPYLIGLVVGLVLCKLRHSTFRLNKWLSVVCYTAMFALMNASFMFSYFFHKPGLPYDPVHAGLYASLSRVGLALSFAGLALTATFADWKLLQRSFSWPPLRVMSRLTYGAYLVHTIGHFFDKGTRRVSQQTTVFAGVWLLFGDMVFSYGLAFVLMLLLESPVRRLEKLLFRRAAKNS